MKIAFVRWLLTAFLLYVIWHHSHWSVALLLTLLCIGNELVAVTVTAIAAAIKRATEKSAADKLLDQLHGGI